MELMSVLAILGVIALLMMAACGIWATYWAVVRGCQQMIVGLQSIDARLADLGRK